MPTTRRYLLPSTSETYTPSKMKRLSVEEQIEIMNHWFEARFVPPTELPYDSGEGGIQWVGSGPYDAGQQLRQEFEKAATDEAIDRLSSELSDMHYEWAERFDDSDYDNEEMTAWLAGIDPFFSLMSSLDDIENTAKRKRTIRDGKILHRLLFSSVIASLEAYLGDALAKVLHAREDLLISFYQTAERFRDADPKPMGTVPTEEHMKVTVEQFLSRTVWHNLKKAGKSYKTALGVEFPSDLPIIEAAVEDRHDIVHRNGKSKAGILGTWGVADILTLKEAVIELASSLEVKLNLIPSQSNSSSDDLVTI